MSTRYHPTAKHHSMSKINTPIFDPVLSPSRRSPQKTNSFREKAKVSSETKIIKKTKNDLSYEKVLQTETSIGKDNSHLINESLLIGNLAQEPTASEISLFHTLGNEFRDDHELSNPEKYNKRLIGEIISLQRELAQKDSVIDKLMRENANLRKEMEEFIITIDEAREYIDVELKESTQKVLLLENEINELKEENKHFKERLQQAYAIIEQNEHSTGSRGKEVMSRLEEEVEDYYTMAQKDMETFYFKIHEQILEYMDTSKKQFKDFSQHAQSRISNETLQEGNTADTLNSRIISFPKSPMSANQKEKSPEWNRTNSFKSESSPSVSKGSKPLTPILKKSTSKKSLDQSGSTLNDITTESKSSSHKKRLGSASISQIETVQEKTVGFILDNEKNESFRKSQVVKDSLSPKSSLLRAKLRSDVILQEMRRKLAEGANNM